MFGLFGKTPVEVKGIFLLRCEVHPMSLRSAASDYVDLEIEVENVSTADQLTAVVLTVPKGLGTDKSAISQQREVRLGYLRPGEKKFLKIQVWGTQRTVKGTYPLRVVAIAHFHDYAHVVNEAGKTLQFRVG